MTKRFLIFIMLFLIGGAVFAQPPAGTWEFDGVPICGYDRQTLDSAAAVNIPGFKNAYSVTLAPDGKVWAGSYYSRYTEWTSEYVDSIYVVSPDTVEIWRKPIFIWDPATQVAETLYTLTLPDQSLDTLVAGHRGMCTDPDGNIIAGFSDGVVYKINHQTYDVIRKFESGGGGGRPGVDADGYVYQMDGVFPSKVDILDPDDWTAPFNTINLTSDVGVGRCMEVSPDGKNVYMCTQSGGVHRYYSADGVFGTYTIADTLLATVMVDTAEKKPYTNLAQWHPSGLLWVATFEDTPPTFMWALDPDQNYMVVDSLKEIEWWGNTDKSDTTWMNYHQPQYLRCVRDAAFNPAGDEVYFAEFYGYAIKKFKFVPSTSIQPDRDSKVVPGLFTLYHNYPNPFNPTTIIPFELHKRAHVILRVYDSLGRLVGTYYDKPLNTGLHEFTFDARDLASGQYYFKLTVDRSVATGKMLLLK